MYTFGTSERCPDYRGVPISGSPHFEVPLYNHSGYFNYTLYLLLLQGVCFSSYIVLTTKFHNSTATILTVL